MAGSVTTSIELPVAPPEPLPVPVIDCHVHLDIITEYSGLQIEAGLAAAADVGVPGVIQIGIDLPTSRLGAEIAREHERVLGTAIALHPNEAPKRQVAGRLDSDLAALAELAEEAEVIAIGETGLDYFRTGPEGVDAQRDSFREHIRLARAAGLTLVIHDRDAHRDVIEVLESEDPPERVVFHCFSGDAKMARIVTDAGWYVSFSGVVTFKNAPELRAALEVVPDELVLAETDAPFLTPTPDRGRPNASYLLPNTVRTMARVRSTGLAGLCQQLTDNTVRAFALDESVVAGLSGTSGDSLTDEGGPQTDQGGHQANQGGPLKRRENE